MTSEQWRRVEELYRAAQDRPSSQRAAFLQAASPDESVRREVDLLLGPQTPDNALYHHQGEGRLTPGQRIGPYQVMARIGAGGMGEVWKARDLRLGRDVALKVGASRFSDGFQREARAIAALNHPNICTLFDVGADYLVMEYVEGKAIGGPLPLKQVLQLGAQIADALSAAHCKGIVHRDLKPANILVTGPSGHLRIKLLDFGLAKIDSTSGSVSDASATLTATREGSVVGTLQYMSPEQLQGKAVDARSDIFSLGSVLYELVTGQRAFEGRDWVSITAAILKEQPPAIQPALAPGAFARAVGKCLAKDPEDRWQTARDLKSELEWIAEVPETTAVAWARGNAGPWRVIGALLAVALLVCTALLYRAPRPVEYPVTRLSVDLGPNVRTGFNLTAAISPDGRRLVFLVRLPDGRQQLATRLLDQAEATLLPGTENGSDPFFSPDGQWIGFFVLRELKKISVQGGGPLTLATATATSVYGAAWGQDGTIVSSLGNLSPLSRIPAGGGQREALTRLAPGEVSHRWPQVLPGGNAVLFTAASALGWWDDAKIEAVSLKTGQTKIVQRGGYFGRYLPGGYLIYVHQGALLGVRFDAAKLEVRGAPVPILQDVAANPTTGGGQFDCSWAPSGHGTLVYLAGKGTAEEWELDWLDSSGSMQPILSTLAAYRQPRFSPDGRKLAYVEASDIYVYDLERDSTMRLTFTGRSALPVWAPDSKHLAFSSTAGEAAISWMRSDGAAEPQRLIAAGSDTSALIPWSFSPNGRRLAYHASARTGGSDLWTVPLDLSDPSHPKPGVPEPLLNTTADEWAPQFSPDGRWIAYTSDESGEYEIYVRSSPDRDGGKWQISRGGGRYAFWSKNGRQLFYETGDNRIMVVDYRVENASFVPGKARAWYDKPLFNTGSANLDLAADSRRFIVLSFPEAAPAAEAHVTMLFNFLDELRRRIP